MRPSARILSTYAALLLLFVGVTAAIGKGPPPKDDDPSAAGELYGDLYVLERDGNGEPILYSFEYEDSENGSTVEVECAMPLAGGCSDLGDCYFVPLNVEKEDFDPETEDACGAQTDYKDCLQEVSFGRGSVARSQPFVIDSAYSEVIKTINEAVGIGRDPAGRLKLELPSADGLSSVSKTIDAPLENLGLYREVMTNGCLGQATDEVTGEGGVVTEVVYALDESAIALLCGELYDGSCVDGGPYASLLCGYSDYPNGVDWWLTPEIPDPVVMEDQDLLWATTFIAGATDKGDSLSLDEIVNVNTYLGINAHTFEKVKKDRVLTVTYFDFGSFTYARDLVFAASTFGFLLTSLDGVAFQADDDLYLFDDETHGVDLDAVNLSVCRVGEIYGNGDEVPLVCDSASDEPYLPESEEFGCGGANWFAQAAEHARKTIWYVHNWAVPEIAY